LRDPSSLRSNGNLRSSNPKNVGQQESTPQTARNQQSIDFDDTPKFQDKHMNDIVRKPQEKNATKRKAPEKQDDTKRKNAKGKEK